MATLAVLATRIAALEDELYAMRAGHDFVSDSPDGGKTEVKNIQQARAALRAELKALKREYWARSGGQVAEPSRQGIDFQRDTTNSDDP